MRMRFFKIPAHGGPEEDALNRAAFEQGGASREGSPVARLSAGRWR
jgi:hypothetical protein